jgi:hypothetical protein
VLRRYLQGLLGDSQRKSMQAMLERVTDPGHYQTFQHFITHATWDWQRRFLLISHPGVESKACGPKSRLYRLTAMAPNLCIKSGFEIRMARVSPDGRWLAYVSNESGRDDVYVQSFPALEGKWQVSTNRGEKALFSVRIPRAASFRRDRRSACSRIVTISPMVGPATTSLQTVSVSC